MEVGNAATLQVGGPQNLSAGLPETTRWKQFNGSDVSSGLLSQYIFPANNPCYQQFQEEKTGARIEV